MAIALSGGINTFGEFKANTRGGWIKGVAYFLLRSGWELVEKVRAFATATISHMPTDGTTYTFVGLTYTFKASINNAIARQVKLGADIQHCMENLVAAANNGAGAGTLYSNVTLQHPFVILETQTVGMTTTLTARSRTAGPDGVGPATDVGQLLGGGYKLRGQSPQYRTVDGEQFKVIVYLFDDQHTSGISGHPPQASIRIISNYDGTLLSTIYHCQVGAGLVYRIICCQCQAFVYREGVDAAPGGSVVCFGIPWVPLDKCMGEVITLPTNEAWYISADEGSVPSSTPRTVIVDQTRVTQTAPNVSELPADSGVTNVNTWQSSDACFNGIRIGPGNNAGVFRCVSLTPPNRWDIVLSSGNTTINSLRWFGPPDPDDDDHPPTYVPMLLEPMVAWSNVDNTNPPLVRGQFYDGWFRTSQSDMDAVDDGTDPDNHHPVYAGYKMLAFTDRSKFGTLWLIIPSLEPDLFSNVQTHYAF